MKKLDNKDRWEALYGIAILCTRGGTGLRRLVSEVAEELYQGLKAAGDEADWGEPPGLLEELKIRIHLQGFQIEYPPSTKNSSEVSDPRFLERSHAYRIPIPKPRSGLSAGEIKVVFLRDQEKILTEEGQFLIEVTARLLGEAGRRIQAEGRRRRQNRALRELVVQMAEERKKIFRKIGLFLDGEVLPQIQSLKIVGEEEEFEKLEKALQGLAGRVDLDLRLEGLPLSVREREICGFIKAGMSSKEIAAHLGLSELTVERHRHNIRRKLGLERGRNLATYLMNY